MDGKKKIASIIFLLVLVSLIAYQQHRQARIYERIKHLQLMTELLRREVNLYKSIINLLRAL